MEMKNRPRETRVFLSHFICSECEERNIAAENADALMKILQRTEALLTISSTFTNTCTSLMCVMILMTRAALLLIMMKKKTAKPLLRWKTVRL